MIRPITLALYFTFLTAILPAQSWKWAVETPDASVIDVATGNHGQSIVVSKGHENDFHVDVYDSTGLHANELVMYFNDWRSNELFAVETDDTGNIYLVSRKVLDIAPPIKFMREWWDQGTGHGWYEDEFPGTPDYHTFIVLEKYSPDLKLITEMRVLKVDGTEGNVGLSEYSVSVRDFHVDGKGNCWIAGIKESDSRMYWREDKEIIASDRACHFLMKVGAAMKQPEWIATFEGGNGGDVNTMHIAVNKDGICVMSGCFYDTIKFGDKKLYAHHEEDKQGSRGNEMYLTAVDANGKVLWAQSTGVFSDDEDVVALSGGDFVASGRCMNANHIGETKLAKTEPVAMFLVQLNPATGRHEKLYFNDTSAINNLEPGNHNDFYCDFQLRNSSSLLFIYHFDSKLKPTLVSRYLAHEPVTCSSNGVLFYSATWSGSAAFGFRPYEAYLPGDLSYSAGFLAKFTMK